MTRLTRADLRNLEGSLAAYEHYLKDTTGLNLIELALEAAGLSTAADARRGVAGLHFGVIPASGGPCFIGGFAQSVAAILNHLGCRSFVTEATDVDGLSEAVAHRPTGLFMSNAHDFLAIDPSGDTIIHNTSATAQGYVAGLAHMAGGLADRKVLLLGCGRLGTAAARALLARGARLLLVDRIPERRSALMAHLHTGFDRSTGTAIESVETTTDADLIFDATNTGDHIDVARISRHTLVAAPGMPCGVTAAARRMLGNRLLHDPIQIGVATMAAKIFAAQNHVEAGAYHAHNPLDSVKILSQRLGDRQGAI
jgi:3-methylornithyl-N6-L-lysine dehydrogenase